MRFRFDEAKSESLRGNPKRGIGFEEAQELFTHPYYLDQRSGDGETFGAYVERVGVAHLAGALGISTGDAEPLYWRNLGAKALFDRVLEEADADDYI